MTNLEKYFNKPMEEMTPADWDKLDEIIENFHGTQANLGKVQRYRRIASLAKGLLKTRPHLRIKEDPPRKDRMWAMVTVDFQDLTALMGKDMDLFKEMVLLSDTFTMAKGEKKGKPNEIMNRIMFTITDVWEADF